MNPEPVADVSADVGGSEFEFEAMVEVVSEVFARLDVSSVEEESPERGEEMDGNKEVEADDASIVLGVGDGGNRDRSFPVKWSSSPSSPSSESLSSSSLS